MMEASCSRFTAAEGGARLVAAAAEKNILVVEHTTFISTRLLYEEAHKIRGKFSTGRQRSVQVTRASKIESIVYDYRALTDLSLVSAHKYDDVQDWRHEVEENEVLVCTSEVLKRLFEDNILGMKDLNVLIIDSCHLIYRDENLKYILKQYKKCEQDNRPRILALTYPLFNSIKIDSSNESKVNESAEPIANVELDNTIVKDDPETDIDRIAETISDNLKLNETKCTIDKIIDNDSKSNVTDKFDDVNSKLEQINIDTDDTNKSENGIIDNKKKEETGQSEETSNVVNEIGVYRNFDDFAMYEQLEWKIDELEKELCCQMDLAEDIDNGKRLTLPLTKLMELIIEHRPRPTLEELPQPCMELERFMRQTVGDAMAFLDDHRYDLTEIYGEDMIDEFKDIPDPRIVPKHLFTQFLYILDQLGPYAADKAAFSLLSKLETLRIKTPYERHFLLLRVCTTVFIKMRCYADQLFSTYATDWDKIKHFSTPKVLRLVEILEKFQPEDRDNANCDKVRMLSDIEKCDFVSLGDKIEDKVNTIKCNLKEIVTDDQVHCNKGHDTVNTCDSAGNSSNNNKNTLNSTTDQINTPRDKLDSAEKLNTSASKFDSARNEVDKAGNRVDTAGNKVDTAGNKADTAGNKVDTVVNKVDQEKSGGLWPTKRTGPRLRGRGRPVRNNAGRAQQQQQNPDALCGVMFMNEPLMAKIMFYLIVDMTRSNPALAFLRAQYCAADSESTEPRDYQRQGKKQEDVLKKFRMHECNLLLATSALEEGIDLPRCNLVLRWDIPSSYRSHATVRGRARAPRAAATIVCARADSPRVLRHVAVYAELDQMISRKCGCGIQDEPPQTEEDHADTFTFLVKPYTPHDNLEKTLQITLQVNKDKDNDKTVTNEATSNINANDVEQNVNIEKDTSKTDLDSETNHLQLSKNALCDNITKLDDTIGDINKTKYIPTNIEEMKQQKTKIQELLTMNGVIETKNAMNKINVTPNGYISNEICDIYNDNNKDVIVTLNNEETNKSNAVDQMYIKTNDLEEQMCNNLENIQNNCNILVNNDNIETKLIKTLMIGDNVSADNQSDIKVEMVANSDVINLDRPSEVDINSRNECSNGNSINTGNRVENACESKKENEAKIDVASVDLSTAIPLINRYCAKLPSDTFTRLAPQWWIEQVHLPVQGTGETSPAYICTLRLPLNCPVKYNIVGHPMPTRVLARRMVALQACRILHKSGELDNQLMPIGKENFRAAELESTVGCLNGDLGDPNDLARPGTTKRRQYYYKKTAWAFTDCQPVIDTTDSEIDATNITGYQPKITNDAGETKCGKRNMLYAIVSRLWCGLPERYNTRGRRLHAPQHATQALGILMARDRPDRLQIPPFPVYTRSGEVRVWVDHVADADVRLSPRRAKLIRRFMRFVFAEVLRVQRRGMRLQADGATHNNYYIVPTVKSLKEDGTAHIDIDWSFLELIYQHTEQKDHSDIDKPLFFSEREREKNTEKEKESDRAKKMENPLLKAGEVFRFDPEKYKEAVVTPWYRNQDQPQFFLVAEICWNLNPDSAFPSATHASFREYYSSKYGVTLTQSDQPLLDVDHTSARLNLLTPRYVNRKGVALPVSSERTRRAKRDRLDQKQILVPELCRVHPFAAPLWFATVALPCILYRINALLIADEIRRAVAIDVGLGIPKIDDTDYPGFQWPPLDFGWSLAEVLNADSERSEKKRDEEDTDGKESNTEDSNAIEDSKEESSAEEKTINDILQEKEDAENTFEIGTWSNEMASNIQTTEYNEFLEPLPSNLTLCTSASGGVDWSERTKRQFNPTHPHTLADSDCSYMSSEFDTDDTDSDMSDDNDGFMSNLSPMSFRIEYKTPHEAEAFDVERKKVNPAPLPDAEDDAADRALHDALVRTGNAPKEYIEKFYKSVVSHENNIVARGYLIKDDKRIDSILPNNTQKSISPEQKDASKLLEMFPYNNIEFSNGKIDIETIERNKRLLLSELKKSSSMDEIKKLKCFSMVDVDIDAEGYVNEKVLNIGFNAKENYIDKVSKWETTKDFVPYYEDVKVQNKKEFDFDYQPKLEGHPGPSPSVILQALTMSNANDGINLERLETIGDSFLKFAITAYLYCAHPTVHEGKLSHMRSKQVSNLNLYRLGRCRRLGARMIASKFEPHDNWLPPCHRPPPTLLPQHHHQSDTQERVIPESSLDSSGCFIPYNLITQHSIPDKSIADCVEALIGAYLLECGPRGALLFMSWLGLRVLPQHDLPLPPDHPYCRPRPEGATVQKPAPQPSTEHSYDTSDSGTELSSDEECEEQQQHQELAPHDWSWPGRPVGSLRPYKDERGRWMQPIFGELKAPPSPLLRYIEDPEGELEQMLSGYDALERTLQYRFKDRSLLLQALTHASHNTNRLTDCYQRLEFLGDAILDYLITRHLYEDSRRHSPGALTDLRSALVNNTIFAALAARHSFHKYFRHMSPGLNEVLTKYVKIQEENGHSISEEHYLIQEDEMEQAEDVEVPKALGDLFESVAGAIFLDSGMSLDAVWKSYVNLMGAELEAFSAAAPKSPVRELLEAEPDTAKFGKPERLADGRRVRVCVEVFGRGVFKGVGRNYRIAKGTAARCALRHLRASSAAGKPQC